MKHLDISGIGHCGKSAISDYKRIRWIPCAQMTLNLIIKVTRGYFRFKKAIIDEWSLIKSIMLTKALEI